MMQCFQKQPIVTLGAASRQRHAERSSSRHCRGHADRPRQSINHIESQRGILNHVPESIVPTAQENIMANTELPARLKDHAGPGGLGVGDLEVPRLKLLQASSPELAEFNNARQGEFWHSLIDERIGSTVRICPIYINWRFILWRPREAGGGILARADDGKHWMPADSEFTVKLKSGHEVTWRTARTVAASGLNKRGSYDPGDPDSPPAVTRMYSIVCSFPDRQDWPPAVVILQRTAIKVATKLIGQLKVLRAPSFGVILEMASFKDKSPSGEFYNYAFEIDGPVEDKLFYGKNFAQYRFFIEQGLKVKDLEGAQED
jgi:hypothetical protein